jgi:hypothetical protein
MSGDPLLRAYKRNGPVHHPRVLVAAADLGRDPAGQSQIGGELAGPCSPVWRVDQSDAEHFRPPGDNQHHETALYASPRYACLACLFMPGAGPGRRARQGRLVGGWPRESMNLQGR